MYVRFCQFSVVGSQVIYAPENCGPLTTKRHLHLSIHVNFDKTQTKNGQLILFLDPHTPQSLPHIAAWGTSKEQAHFGRIENIAPPLVLGWVKYYLT